MWQLPIPEAGEFMFKAFYQGWSVRTDTGFEDAITYATLELRYVTSTKATFLWFGNILTFNLGFDAEATTRQYTITFGLALSAKIAATKCKRWRLVVV